MSAAGLRALGLAVVLVLALLALGIGAVTTATAAAGNVSASPSPVNASTPVTANASADTPGADLTFAIDGDGDGTVTSAEALGTVPSDATTGNASLTAALGPYVAGDGTVPVYVVEEATSDGVDDTAYPVGDPATFYDADTTVEIDDTPPTISNVTVTNPAGREIRVTFDASEPLQSVTAEIEGPDPGTLTEVDFVATGGGPHAHEATYFPTTDGEYTVTLTGAHDTAGNDGAGGQTASALAAVAGRDADTLFEGSSPVFMGETGVDVSPVVGDGTATFVGVGGPAAGRVVTANASQLDVAAATGFAPGAYDVTGDGNPDVRVSRPTVDDLSVVLERPSSDVEVTDGYLQRGDSVALRAGFAFGAVDDLTVSVVDPSGVDVAPSLTDDRVLSSADETVRLDTGQTGTELGTYTIRVTADSLGSTASASLELVDREPSVSVDRTHVVRGRPVVATVIGPPGGTVVARIPTAQLANESTPATAVFDRTGDVLNRTRGSDHVGAELELGRDGIAKLRVDTDALSPGRSTIQTVAGAAADLDGPPTDAVDLDVAERTVTVDDPPDAAFVNEVMGLSGTAPQLETVVAYARIDDTWHRVGAAEAASEPVAQDGSFELSLSVTGPLAQPGTYQVAVVGRSESASGDAADALDHRELTADPYAVFTVRTKAP